MSSTENLCDTSGTPSPPEALGLVTPSEIRLALDSPPTTKHMKSKPGQVLILDPGTSNLGYLLISSSGRPVKWGTLRLPSPGEIKRFRQTHISYASRVFSVMPMFDAVTHVIIEGQYHAKTTMHRLEAALQTAFECNGRNVWVYAPKNLKVKLGIATGSWTGNKRAVSKKAFEVIEEIRAIYPDIGKVMFEYYEKRAEGEQHNLADPLAAYYGVFMKRCIRPPVDFIPYLSLPPPPLPPPEPSPVPE